MLIFGHPCHFLSQVDSTNNYIADHPSLDHLAEGTAILTYEQTQGRGQRGRTWDCVPGEDLAVSFLVRPKIGTEGIFLLNKTISLALRSVLIKAGVAEVKVKWPNDIFISGKKVAGILIEPQWTGESCKHIIIGLGVNVNSRRIRNQEQGISLMEALGHEFPLSDFFELLSTELGIFYDRWVKGEARWIQSEYDEYLLGRGMILSFATEQGRGSGEIQRVDEMGRLIVSSDAEPQQFFHGAIEVDYSGVV